MTVVLRRRFLLALVAIGLLPVVVGCAPAHKFAFDVAVDMREYTPPKHPGSAYFAGVCEAIRDLGPGAFMISPGDYDPPDAVRATLDDVLGKSYVWYPVVGNHEIETPSDMEWTRAYNAGGRRLPGIVRSGPPGAVETCYSFDYGNAHFVAINQYYDGKRDDAKGGDIGDALYAWLAEDLAATRKPHIFVAGHEPFLPTPDMITGTLRHKGDSLDQFPENAKRFWSLLKKHRVVAYLCGHTHTFSLREIDGVWQVDAGHARGIGGGKEVPSGFVRIRVDGGRIDCDIHRSAAPGKQPYTLHHTQRLR